MSKPVTVAVQLGAAWAMGAVVLPLAWVTLLVAALARAKGPFVVVAFVGGVSAHGYVVRRGEVNVRVLGGLRVARTLLRQAAVEARPATDGELSRAVAPLKPRNDVDRLRRWLRTF